MALAQGTETYAIGDAAASSKTFSHTVPATAHSVLVVGVEQVANTKTVSATYNGNAMTKLADLSIASNDRYITYLYILIDSPDGNAHDVVVTLNAAHASYTWLIVASDYSDVLQEAITNYGTATIAAGASPITETITTETAGSWLVGVVGGTKELSAGADTTLRIGNATSSPSEQNACCILDSNGAKTPAGDYALTATYTGNQNEGIIVAELKQYVAGDYTMDCETGSFALTGNDSILTKGFNLICEVGSFVLTGYDAILTVTGAIWSSLSKNSSSYSNTPKNTSTYSNQDKNSSSWTNKSKNI